MSTLPDLVRNLNDDIDARLVEAVEEVASLRDAAGPSSVTETLEDLHARLLRIRHALDRVEFISATLARMRGRTVQAVAEAQAVHDDAWNASATTRKIGFSNEYSSAKERDAAHSMSAMPHMVTLRRLQRIDRDVSTSLDFARAARNHLDNQRREIDLRVRIVTMEGRLDR